MKDVCITRSNTQIPSTMATQHPDNASPAYWHVCPSTNHSCEVITTDEEIEECYRSFHDLGCDEYLWDWEGKFVDEAVIDRLFSKYFDYFQKNQLGRNRFLTFRIPNVWIEETSRLARAFMVILTANEEARRLRINNPPIFEAILPQTDSASKLVQIQDQFRHTSQHYCEIFNTACNFEKISIVPLIEETKRLLESKMILQQYLEQFNSKFNCKVDYIRPFIARSDPALQSGFIPAILAAKVALSIFYEFEAETGVKVYPILGVGSLPFRGGLNTQSINEFLKDYQGIRTVTIQSAFKYDYPLQEVKRAISQLNTELPKCTAPPSIEEDKEEIQQIDTIFSTSYRNTLKEIADFINKIARFIPSHRERKTAMATRGYGREIKGIKTRFPRAIKFTASLYSLGIPPELIGTGRGLHKIQSDGRIALLETICRNLNKRFITIGNFLNRRNLTLLAKKTPGFKLIEKDVHLLEEYVDTELGPVDEDGDTHEKETEKILDLVLKDHSPSAYIVAAAKNRRSLG